MLFVVGPDGKAIAGGEMGEANANLIAAAPEVLAFLKEKQYQLEVGRETWNRLQKVIAKAEGRA